jgi:F-type H+-transporting ATPase subunit c
VSNTLIVAQEIIAQEEPIDLNQGLAMIGYGLGAIGPGIGVGLIWAAVINGSARQPELQGRLMTIAWTTFALVEVLALIGLVLFFIAGGAGA